MFVLTRLDGDDVSVMKVAVVGERFGLIDGAKYVHIGRVMKVSAITPDGFHVQRWHAIADRDLCQPEAATRRKVIDLLLECHDMESVADVQTIPPLF